MSTEYTIPLSVTTKFWAIQQVSTGLLVPAGGKGLRGHTHQEPSGDRPPRLLTSESSAKKALRAYVAGKWYETYYQSYDGESDTGGPDPKTGTERNASDFRVVAVIPLVVSGPESKCCGGMSNVY